MNSCWNNSNYFGEMLRAARGELWGKLQDSSHYRVIKELLFQLPQGKLLDVGCGAGALSEIEEINERFDYYGLDVEGIIENVAKIFNDKAKFISCNILEDDLEFIKEYDVVFMNAFIDIFDNPIFVIRKILQNCNKYVVIHRQSLINEPTRISTHESYGAMTHQSHINVFEFLNNFHGFELIKKRDSGLGVRTNISLIFKKV